jgi:hypothetical protein
MGNQQKREKPLRFKVRRIGLHSDVNSTNTVMMDGNNGIFINGCRK